MEGAERAEPRVVHEHVDRGVRVVAAVLDLPELAASVRSAASTSEPRVRTCLASSLASASSRLSSRCDQHQVVTAFGELAGEVLTDS